MLRHKNVVELHHTLLEGKTLIMIMEVATGGELYDYVKKMEKLPEITARKIIYQVIDGISYCHERRIVHKDLKLENVLFKTTPDEDNLDISIIDFGIAGVVIGGVGEAVDAGSLPYMAPEVLSGADTETTFALDVWAIGIMFYTMLYGKLPFYHAKESNLKDQIINGALKFDPKVPVSDEAKQLITGMLDKDPAKRFRLIAIMDMDYYKMEDAQIEKLVAETEAVHEQKKAEKQAALEAKNEMNQKLGHLGISVQ